MRSDRNILFVNNCPMIKLLINLLVNQTYHISPKTLWSGDTRCPNLYSHMNDGSGGESQWRQLRRYL